MLTQEELSPEQFSPEQLSPEALSPEHLKRPQAKVDIHQCLKTARFRGNNDSSDSLADLPVIELDRDSWITLGRAVWLPGLISAKSKGTQHRPVTSAQSSCGQAVVKP